MMETKSFVLYILIAWGQVCVSLPIRCCSSIVALFSKWLPWWIEHKVSWAKCVTFCHVLWNLWWHPPHHHHRSIVHGLHQGPLSWVPTPYLSWDAYSMYKCLTSHIPTFRGWQVCVLSQLWNPVAFQPLV